MKIGIIGPTKVEKKNEKIIRRWKNLNNKNKSNYIKKISQA